MAVFSNDIFAKADKWLADYKAQQRKKKQDNRLAANAQGGVLYADGTVSVPSDYTAEEAKELKRALAQMYIDEAIKERKNSLRDVEDELYRILPDFKGIRIDKDFDDNMSYEAIWKK